MPYHPNPPHTIRPALHPPAHLTMRQVSKGLRQASQTLIYLYAVKITNCQATAFHVNASGPLGMCC
jgi:hypothetical protein